MSVITFACAEFSIADGHTWREGDCTGRLITGRGRLSRRLPREAVIRTAAHS